MDKVKKFYSKLQFPGPYTINDLEFYFDEIYNKYLKIYDSAIGNSKSVLDVGCGSGFILNLLALRHPTVHFDAIDFGDGIDYAWRFAQKNKIKNIKFHKQDFLKWKTNKKFDLVISNGVVHHIPEYEKAIEKIKVLSADKIAIGVYNTYGKVYKKLFPVEYVNDILYIDQEKCPFEISFTDKQFKKYFKEYQLVQTVPGYKNHFVDFYNLFNYANGGLTVYVFKN